MAEDMLFQGDSRQIQIAALLQLLTMIKTTKKKWIKSATMKIPGGKILGIPLRMMIVHPLATTADLMIHPAQMMVHPHLQVISL
ncbi:hypothetical protein [Paenibacillus sp. NRS-1760]|uniref:hypothetical protein n=1 Tax=Paenibacillus sp. NRS-1760 TaxID=3233902 RepID=UPI003D296CC7